MKDLNDMSLEELWELFPIVLQEHNPNYASWYNAEKERLLRVLRGFHVRRVSHIGSTAVDGLIAKPIVDIMLELPETYDMDAAACRLENNGWIVMRRDTGRRLLDLNKGYTPEGFAEKTYHLHIKPPGDWGELYFRDYLREKPGVARRYEALKKSLLQRFEHDRDAYTEAKSAFILENTQKAREEYAGRYLPRRL